MRCRSPSKMTRLTASRRRARPQRSRTPPARGQARECANPHRSWQGTLYGHNPATRKSEKTAARLPEEQPDQYINCRSGSDSDRRLRPLHSARRRHHGPHKSGLVPREHREMAQRYRIDQCRTDCRPRQTAPRSYGNGTIISVPPGKTFAFRRHSFYHQDQYWECTRIW